MRGRGRAQGEVDAESGRRVYIGSCYEREKNHTCFLVCVCVFFCAGGGGVSLEVTRVFLYWLVTGHLGKVGLLLGLEQGRWAHLSKGKHSF
jgi:hypothetical protein